MSRPPMVSVVIPCYNYGRFVEDAIDSCLRSTFSDIEIIVVNDGSTDLDTLHVLDRLSMPKTRVLHQANKGVSSARNAGVRHADGQYILPLDADDMIDPRFLAKVVAVLEQHPHVGFAGTWLRCFGESDSLWSLPPYNFHTMLFQDIMFTASLFRKAAWTQVGGYNESMPAFEDWDFWIALGEKGWLGHTIPEPLFFYRRHGPSLSRQYAPMYDQFFAQIKRNHPDLYTEERLEELRRIWSATVPVPQGALA